MDDDAIQLLQLIRVVLQSCCNQKGRKLTIDHDCGDINESQDKQDRHDGDEDVGHNQAPAQAP